MKRIFIAFLGVITVLPLSYVAGYSIGESSAVCDNIKKEINVSGVVKNSEGNNLSGVTVKIKGTNRSVRTKNDGKFTILAATNATLEFSISGFISKEIAVKGRTNIGVVTLMPDQQVIADVLEVLEDRVEVLDMPGFANVRGLSNDVQIPRLNNERYDSQEENNFKNSETDPISVFSVDVDNAGYSNVRRFLNYGTMPPSGSVRIEEMINYFKYDYPFPTDNSPVKLNAEISGCPWNSEHQLLRLGLQAKNLNPKTVPPSNLVFLIDCSGSMDEYNKMPLLIRSFKVLVENMTENDRVAIVTYASGSGVKLQSTRCNTEGKKLIVNTLEGLMASGYTAGQAGIDSAYAIAQKNFIKGGNNRIFLATDGDFNIGQSSDAELKTLIETKRESGIYITVLGFGMGNYNDSMMEKIADYGNGNYYYIDTYAEAKKALGDGLWGTLYTVAKDVKLLVDFNPNKVKSYRLIGYENRVLNNEDFDNDKKDAGDMGAGHSVTALYELVPTTSKEKIPSTVKSEYQKLTSVNSADWLTIKFRYKEPSDTTSKLVSLKVTDKDFTKLPSNNMKLSSSVAEFGMLLNNSKFKAGMSYNSVLDRLSTLKSDDQGYIDELKVLVRKANTLSGTN
ncbi:MAG: von Willebrand factor type A domain-containing protein [Bacteroidales bacterium]|nr:von Willebrand factor type A domain-containing protein [Bacteroidales bacterium]